MGIEEFEGFNISKYFQRRYVVFHLQNFMFVYIIVMLVMPLTTVLLAVGKIMRTFLITGF